MRIQYIKYIHEKILIEGTGSPKELALLLNTSERTIYNYIKYMRLELKALKVEYKDDMSLDEMRQMTDVVIERVYNEENLNQR